MSAQEENVSKLQKKSVVLDIEQTISSGLGSSSNSY